VFGERKEPNPTVGPYENLAREQVAVDPAHSPVLGMISLHGTVPPYRLVVVRPASIVRRCHEASTFLAGRRRLGLTSRKGEEMPSFVEGVE
jgi:hypothetical protein